MTALTPNDVHVDQLLTNLVVANLQTDATFVADRVFPALPVEKQSDKYYVWNRDDYNRVGQVKPLAPGVETETIGLSLSQDNYFIEVEGLAMDFTEQMLANEDTQLNTRTMGANTLLHQMRLKREQDWFSSFFASGVWATEYTGVVNADNDTAAEVTHWDDLINSTPIKDITAAKRALHLKSGGSASMNDTIMVMTPDVEDVLMNHPDILARINGGATTATPAMVNRQRLAEVFGVAEILVPDAVINTAKEGQTATEQYIETKKVALYSRPRAAGLMVPASGYMFTWNGLANANPLGIAIRSFSDGDLARKHIAEKIESVMGYDMKVVNNSMGVFFNTIIS